MRSVRRVAWEAGGRIWAHGVALAVVLVITRELGLRLYGEYVVLLALLAAATLAWNMTVLQAVAADMGRGAGQRSWDRFLLRWLSLGAAVITPVVWILSGPAAAAALTLTAASEAFRVRALPLMILRGQQRRIALATGLANAVRLVLILALAGTGRLSPVSALLCQAAAFVTAGLLQGFPTHHGKAAQRPLGAELSVEALRWVETYAPILGVAAFLGIATAGGFDLLLKLVTVSVEVLTTIGVVVLPQLLGSRDKTIDALTRSIRVPTAIAALGALLFAFAAVPAIQRLTGSHIDAGASAALLATVMLLAPWEAVSKAALLSMGRAWWLLPTQIAISSTALAGAVLTPLGLSWAAAAIAAGHLAASVVFATGLAQTGILPPPSALLSATSTMKDFRASWTAFASRQVSS